MTITVYGTPVCPNCGDVKRFLESAGVGYEYKTVGEDIDAGALGELVGRPVRSVPVIMVGDKEMNFDELRNFVAMNDLEEGLGDMSL